jgi:hypothetical protein
MLKAIFGTEVEKLEQAAATAKANLDKIKSQHELALGRATELANRSAELFADQSSDAEAVEQEHVAASSRARSLEGAVSLAAQRVIKAEEDLASAKEQAAREKSAATCRDLAKELEKAKPVAGKAASEVAAIVGRLPTKAYWPGGVDAALKHHVTTAREFFEGDFVDLAVAELRRHADEILGGRRPHDLGWSFDEQAEAYGGKVVAAKKVA